MTRPEITRDEHHQYMVNGEKFPSVTQILSTVVPEAWEIRKKAQQRNSRAARNIKSAGKRGVSIHELFDHYGKTGEVRDDMPAPLARWIIDNHPEFLFTERMTASLEHRYAGTPDIKARLHSGPYAGALALLDLKTNREVKHDSYFPQLEAYEHAEVECGEDPTDFRAVLWLPPEGEAELVISTDTFADFLVLLYHYRSVKARERRLLEAA